MNIVIRAIAAEQRHRQGLRAMRYLVRHGRPWVQRTHHDSSDSGPFTVKQDGLRLGQLRFVFITKGAYVTPHFILYRGGHHRFCNREFVLNRGDPGYAVVLREFGRQTPSLAGSLFINPGEHGSKGRMPVWHCYLPDCRPSRR